MTWLKQSVESGKDVARAVAFLSRIPMPAALFADDTHKAAAQQAWAFPLAGLVIGAYGALIILIFGQFASALLVAVLAIAGTTIITGALHEDGLADVADGFWGGWTVERRLDIMKDSTVGAYGVLALVIWFALAATALSDVITALGPAPAALCWLTLCAASRAAMTVLWATTKPARTHGVAHAAGQPANRAAVVSLVATAVIAMLAIGLGGPLVLLPTLLLVGLKVFFLRLLCLEKIGGHTGDTLGATQKVAEMVGLVGLAIML
ncbi:MAG: adenosylcobinamide-GDP ribazoletransferase [Ahrensia sp.]